MVPSSPAERDRIGRWLEALEARSGRDLTFAEIRRGLQALSSLYVERRGARLAAGGALTGRGKRAAFALFYGPLHFLLVTHIARSVAIDTNLTRIVDIGCGTGVASAAWALATSRAAPSILGVDKNAWALSEARWTWSQLGLQGRALRQDAGEVEASGAGVGVVAAFTLNEVSDDTRGVLRSRLLASPRRGRLLVIEPLARGVAPWWSSWRDAVLERGGREDEWRFPVELPETLRRLDRAAGLNHGVLSARTLWL